MSDIVGYTFKAEQYCADVCGRDIALQGTQDAGSATMWGDSGTTEAVLGEWALLIGVDRQHEDTFDSGEFPKRIYRDQCGPNERCGRCNMKLFYTDDDEFFTDLEKYIYTEYGVES